MSANQTQVGGSHYKDMKIQPVDYIHANGLGFIEGCVVKYVSRHKSKNGKQDLEKAIHFLQLLIEREYPKQIVGKNWKVALKPKYRLLNETDTIRRGDQFNGEELGWMRSLMSGVRMEKHWVGQYRRPIKPKEAK